MDTSVGIDWCDYLHHLSDHQMHELAAWLAAEYLNVSEFTDIIDRVYAQASDEWRRRPPAFIDHYGRPMVARYAHRKRGFAERLAALEDAYMSGAFKGDVAAAELAPSPLPQTQTEAHRVIAVLDSLERMRSGS